MVIGAERAPLVVNALKRFKNRALNYRKKEREGERESERWIERE